MPRLLISFGCCLAKPGSVGQREGQRGLGLNLLRVTWQMISLLGDPVLPALPLSDVTTSIHTAHVYICNEAQDTLSPNQRLILDFIKETNGRNTDMNWAERVSLNHQGQTDKYNHG